MSAPKPIQLPDASKMPGRAMHAREAWRFRRGLGLDQDQRRENTTVIVYMQPQYEQQASTDLDVAKLTLAKLMVDARKQILYRVNELPGSSSSSELWIRYRQIEDKAQALGRQGLWLRALEGFKANFQTLLTAVPTGEPVRVGYGARGVGACGDKCKNCMGCVACAGRRALDDFVSLLERIQRALKRGDRHEAEQALVRAKDVAKKLGPGDQEKAQIDLRNFGAKVDAKAAAQGVGRVRGVGDAPMEVQQFDYFMDNAKRSAASAPDQADNYVAAATRLWDSSALVQGQRNRPEPFSRESLAARAASDASHVVKAKPDDVWAARRQGFGEGLSQGADDLSKGKWFFGKDPRTFVDDAQKALTNFKGPWPYVGLGLLGLVGLRVARVVR